MFKISKSLYNRKKRKEEDETKICAW